MKNILKKFVAFLLAEEARLVLRKYQPKLVAITGTVGKTSTKEAVYRALQPLVSVRKSPKNFNNEFGVPLTILEVSDKFQNKNPFHWLEVFVRGLDLILLPNLYPEYLVLEVGTDQPGDIQALTKWLKPDVVIVTRLAQVPVHVEAFKSPETLFQEKGYLVRALKSSGTLILNSEDKNVLAYKNIFAGKTVLFGNGRDSDLRAENYKIDYDEAHHPIGVSFEAGGNALSLAGTLGEAQMYHMLAALATSQAVGENLSLAAKALSGANPVPGRMHLINGLKGSIIVDDTYNSSPIALEEALKTLKTLKKGRGRRKIAVLGDMLELGRYSIGAHREAGERVAKVADILVAVGVRSRLTAEAALEAGMGETNILQFDEAREAGDYLQNIVAEGDLILVKGSQSMRMERVVEEIMLNPEDKEKLLVRQGEEWRSTR